VKSISQIKFCQFATASINGGQLQTVFFKDGLKKSFIKILVSSEMSR